MNLKDLVRDYVQQRTVLLVDGRHFEAGKEFAALRRQPSSEAIVNTVDALDYALGLLNQKDAEIERLKSQLEQVDTVRNGWMGCHPAPTGTRNPANPPPPPAGPETIKFRCAEDLKPHMKDLLK